MNKKVIAMNVLIDTAARYEITIDWNEMANKSVEEIYDKERQIRIDGFAGFLKPRTGWVNTYPLQQQVLTLLPKENVGTLITKISFENSYFRAVTKVGEVEFKAGGDTIKQSQVELARVLREHLYTGRLDTRYSQQVLSFAQVMAKTNIFTLTVDFVVHRSPSGRPGYVNESKHWEGRFDIGECHFTIQGECPEDIEEKANARLFKMNSTKKFSRYYTESAEANKEKYYYRTSGIPGDSYRVLITPSSSSYDRHRSLCD